MGTKFQIEWLSAKIGAQKFGTVSNSCFDLCGSILSLKSDHYSEQWRETPKTLANIGVDRVWEAGKIAISARAVSGALRP